MADMSSPEPVDYEETDTDDLFSDSYSEGQSVRLAAQFRSVRISTLMVVISTVSRRFYMLPRTWDSI